MWPSVTLTPAVLQRLFFFFIFWSFPPFTPLISFFSLNTFFFQIFGVWWHSLFLFWVFALYFTDGSSSSIILVKKHSCLIHLPRILRSCFFSAPPDRSSSPDWSGDSHCVHSGHLLWVDRSDLAHPPHDGGGNPGQHGGPGAAALPVWLHHPGQKAPIPARARLWTHEVGVNSTKDKRLTD